MTRPVTLPGGAVWIPPELLAGLLSLLRVGVDASTGRTPPAAVRRAPTPGALAVLAAVAEGAQQHAEHQALTAPSAPGPAVTRPHLAPPPPLGTVMVGAGRAADVLGLSARQVRRLALNGSMPARRDAHGFWLFTIDDLKAHRGAG